MRLLAAAVVAASVIGFSFSSALAAGSNATQPKSPETLGVCGCAKAIGEDPIDVDPSEAEIAQLPGECIGGGAFISGLGCASMKNDTILTWRVSGG